MSSSQGDDFACFFWLLLKLIVAFKSLILLFTNTDSGDDNLDVIQEVTEQATTGTRNTAKSEKNHTQFGVAVFVRGVSLILTAVFSYSEKRKYAIQPQQSTEQRKIRRNAFTLLKQYVESLGGDDILISAVPNSVEVNHMRLMLKSKSHSIRHIPPTKQFTQTH